MGYNLEGDLLVFTPRSLAIYETWLTGGHCFRRRCDEASLPPGWLLPGLKTLMTEAVIPEEDQDDRLRDVDVAGLAQNGALGPYNAFSASEQAFAALVSLGGPAVLLTDDTFAGMIAEEHGLAFRGGLAIAGGGGFYVGRRTSWGWHRSKGNLPIEEHPKSPISEAAAVLYSTFSGAFLFEDYLPRSAADGIYRPAKTMALPDVRSQLSTWSAWQPAS